MNTTHRTAEEQRLHAAGDRSAYWKRWGPYLSERQWGTVREDYSPDGTVWVGASHQTGWTALIAKLLEQLGELGEVRRRRAERI